MDSTNFAAKLKEDRAKVFEESGLKEETEKAILDGFEGSVDGSGIFSLLTKEEYIGWVAAITKMNHLSTLNASPSEILIIVRELVETGKL